MTLWKFKVLREINYRKDYYLNHFFSRFGELDILKRKKRKLISYNSDLRNIFRTLELVMIRLNDDIEQLTHEQELIEIAKNRELTHDETKEIFSLGRYNQFFKLDVKTLFIQTSIFLDKLTRYLCELFHNERPDCRSYYHFAKSIKDFKGQGIDELIRIIKAYQGLYNESKDIRDDYIVHHSKETITTTRSKNYISISLGTSKTFPYKYKSISNETINNFILQLLSFLRDLDNFLCSNIKKIPFKATKRKKTLGKTIKELTDEELETAIKKLEDLISFYNQVEYNREKIHYKTNLEFLNQLKKERKSRK